MANQPAPQQPANKTPDEISRDAQNAALANAAQAHQNPYTSQVDNAYKNIVQQPMPQDQGGGLSQHTANMLSRGTGSPFDAVNELVVGTHQANAEQAQHEHQQGLQQRAMDMQNAQILQAQQSDTANLNQVRAWSADHPQEALHNGIIDKQGNFNMSPANARAFIQSMQAGNQGVVNHKLNSETDSAAYESRLKANSIQNKLNNADSLKAKTKMLNNNYNDIAQTELAKYMGLRGYKTQTQKIEAISSYNSVLKTITESGMTLKIGNNFFAANPMGGLALLEHPTDAEMGNFTTPKDIKRGIVAHAYNVNDQNFATEKHNTTLVAKHMTQNPEFKAKIMGLADASLSEYISQYPSKEAELQPYEKVTFKRTFLKLLQSTTEPTSLKDLVDKARRLSVYRIVKDNKLVPLADSAKGYFNTENGVMNINNKEGRAFISNYWKRNLGVDAAGMVKVDAAINKILTMKDPMLRRQALNRISMINTNSKLDDLPQGIMNFGDNVFYMLRNGVGEALSAPFTPSVQPQFTSMHNAQYR